MTFRKPLLLLHLWLGLAAAPFLTVLGLSGTVLAFEGPLTEMLNPGLLRVPAGPMLPLPELERRVELANPGYRVVTVVLPADDRHSAQLGLTAPGAGDELDLLVDPHDGHRLGRASELRDWIGPIHRLHTHLVGGPAGRATLGWAGVALVVLALSGLVLWWPGKIVRVRATGSRRRFYFELHSALGGASWIFLLLFGASGAIIHWNDAALAWALPLSGAGPPAPFPKVAPGCKAGGPALPLARIVSAAAAAVPGATVTTARLAGNDSPARVILRFPEDHTPAGRTNVFVAPCSGQVLETRSSRAAPVAYRGLAIWNRELHTGDLGGWPTRILAALFSLALPVMAVTGPLIWWGRRRRNVRMVPGPRTMEGVPRTAPGTGRRSPAATSNG